MKKGIYIIGDLCYLFNDDSWSHLCDKVFDFDNYGDFKVQSKNHGNFDCWFHGTAYGDGEFDFGCCNNRNILNINKFNGFPVDSGTIGIVPLQLIDTEHNKLDNQALLNSNSLMVVKFDTDFEPRYENGTFTFDDIQIYTSNDEEETFSDYDDDIFDDK